MNLVDFFQLNDLAADGLVWALVNQVVGGFIGQAKLSDYLLGDELFGDIAEAIELIMKIVQSDVSIAAAVGHQSENN